MFGQRFNLSARLILPYVLLTIMLALIGAFVVIQLVASSAQERFTNRLAEAGRVAADSMVRVERDLLESLRAVAFTEGVAEATAQSNTAALNTLITPLVANNALEFVAVTNPQGDLLLALATDPSTGTRPVTVNDLHTASALQQVLANASDPTGDKFLSLYSVEDQPYVVVAGPVRDTTNQLLGAVLVGLSLETLVADLDAQTQAKMIILTPTGNFLAATLAQPDEGWAVVERPLSALDATEETQLTLYGRTFGALYFPWTARQNTERLGVMAVILPSDYLVNDVTVSRDTFIILFSLGTAGMIVLGFVLSQNIARPILRLSIMSLAVAQGDLTQRSGLRRPDEIGDLAESFDSMTATLQERTAETERLYAETVERNRQLAEANEQLQQMQQQLIQSEKLSSIGQLTAGIVHDVKNPLAVIKGLSELMLDEPGLSQDVQEQLRDIRTHAVKANQIVSDLLTFARQSTPNADMRDMRDTIESAVRLTEYLARRGKVKILKHLPTTPVMLRYDAQQIEQVLINLIANAIHAMPNGGELHLHVEPEEKQVALRVRDTGTGIAPENMRRVFDPFFTTKPEGEGTGLGLSTAYGIVRRHRGQIKVESELGVGTTFLITLPYPPSGADL